MPKTYKDPNALLSRLSALYAERKALEAQAAEIAAEEKALLAQVVPLFDARKIPMLERGGFKLRVGTQPIATIQDWRVLVCEIAHRLAHAETPAHRDALLSVIHKRVSPTALEKLSFEKVFLDGVLLEHKRVALFSAPRKKGDAE